MKVSEIDLPTLKQYLRVDGDDDDILLTAYLDSAKEYMTSYLGCSIADLDKYAPLAVVAMAIVADAYEVRQFTSTTITKNPLIEQMLAMYCDNFLEVSDE